MWLQSFCESTSLLSVLNFSFRFVALKGCQIWSLLLVCNIPDDSVVAFVLPPVNVACCVY